MSKNNWFEKEETQKNFLMAFLIAGVLLAIEAIRYVATLIVDIVFYGHSLDRVIQSYSYAIGFGVAVLILIYLIYVTKNRLKKITKK